jgi:LmbE family N-acetylglucosaminyl deacetylase
VSRVGAGGVHLDLPDIDYRTGDTGDTMRRLVGKLTDQVRTAESLWLPVGLGRHPDHLLTLKAGLAAWRASHRPPLHLYADLPYASTFNWPSWVTDGSRAVLPLAWTRHLLRWRRHHAAMQWSGALASSGLPVRRLTPTVSRLSPEQLAAKLQALEPYRDQTDQLTYGPGGTWTLAQAVEVESWWTLRT